MTDDIKDTGGPAFPVSDIEGFTEYGMTLRDWFAGMALQGMLTQARLDEYDYYNNAHQAYQYADAMLKERAI